LIFSIVLDEIPREKMAGASSPMTAPLITDDE